MDGELGNPARLLAQSRYGAGQERKRGVVHGYDMPHAEQADRIRRLARTHGKAVTDRQQSHVRSVQFADEFHIAEDRRVSRMIHSEAARHSNDEASRLASVDTLPAVVDGIGMKSVSHGDFE